MSNKLWFHVIVSRKFIYLHTNVNPIVWNKTYLINRYISVLYVISLISYPSSVFEYTLTTKQYTMFYMLRTIRIQNQSKTTSRFFIIIIICRCLIKLWIFTLWFISPPYLQIITKSQLSFCFNSIASKTISTFYLSIYFLLFFSITVCRSSKLSTSNGEFILQFNVLHSRFWRFTKITICDYIPLITAVFVHYLPVFSTF